MRTLNVFFWLFALLLLSGVALIGWYVSVPRAALGGTSPPVSAGSVLRGVHFWAAQIALLAALVNVGQAFFVKTNRPHVGWVVGVFVLTGLLWFTGMLLPWDQLNFWLAPVFRAPTGLFVICCLHTLILSVPILVLFIFYVRRLRSIHHETHS